METQTRRHEHRSRNRFPQQSVSAFFGLPRGWLDEEIGSLEPGKRADVSVVDLRAPHLSPPGADLHAAIVYAARASDVTDVLVGGRAVVRDRRLLTLDAAALALAAPTEVARVLRRLRS